MDQSLQSLCGKVVAVSVTLTVVTIAAVFKQNGRATFELQILLADGLTLLFVAWATHIIQPLGFLIMLAVSGILCTIVIYDRHPRNRRLRNLRNREEIPTERLYDQFFTGSKLPKNLVRDLWEELAALLGVPPGKLRPSDRFDTDLSPGTTWLGPDKDLQQIHLTAYCRLKRLGARADLSRVQTVGDYIQLLGELESGSPDSPASRRME